MLAWRIALRYLVSKKSHGAVNIISIISMAGVAVATAAIVVVLSVFNGFTRLAESQLSVIDPDFKIVPTMGKTFADGEAMVSKIEGVPDIVAAVPVIEERALVMHGNTQMPVIIKGIPENYKLVCPLDSTVLDGQWLHQAYGYPAMLSSTGIAIYTGARPATASVIDLYAPRRTGRFNPANPATAFRKQQLMLTGVFQVNQPDYDNDHAFVPLEVARELLEYDTEATQIEVAISQSANSAKVQSALQAALGQNARVLSRAQQEEKSFRMIQIEKWITFLMLAFIAVIAAFNIISTLSLLVIEKRHNMLTLMAMGASRSMIRAIFADLGWIITLAGGILGIILGTALSLAQQWGKFIKLEGDPSQLAIDTYPIYVQPADLLAVLGLLVVIATGIALITRIFSLRNSNLSTTNS